jgi:hypothetical protein
VYQLTCVTCNKRHVRHTDRPFKTRYKEHRREYLHSTLKSNFAKHLSKENHPLPLIADYMEILQHVNKGPMMNTVEKYHIYKETANGNQLNDIDTIAQNTIFDVLIRHP